MTFALWTKLFRDKKTELFRPRVNECLDDEMIFEEGSFACNEGNVDFVSDDRFSFDASFQVRLSFPPAFRLPADFSHGKIDRTYACMCKKKPIMPQ